MAICNNCYNTWKKQIFQKYKKWNELTYLLTFFWHIFWYSFWHILWHSFWHIFWRSFGHFFWHSLCWAVFLSFFPPPKRTPHPPESTAVPQPHLGPFGPITAPTSPGVPFYLPTPPASSSAPPPACTSSSVSSASSSKPPCSSFPWKKKLLLARRHKVFACRQSTGLTSFQLRCKIALKSMAFTRQLASLLYHDICDLCFSWQFNTILNNRTFSIRRRGSSIPLDGTALCCMVAFDNRRRKFRLTLHKKNWPRPPPITIGHSSLCLSAASSPRPRFTGITTAFRPFSVSPPSPL